MRIPVLILALLFAIFTLSTTELRAATVAPHTTTVLISGPIEEKSLLDFRNVLTAAKLGDVVNVHIYSPGGDANEMLKTLRVMWHTKAFVVCHVRTYAASAAANILQACHERHVADLATVLFHMPRVTIKGKEVVITQEYVKTNPGFARAYTMSVNIFKAFGIQCAMTKKEWTDMINGKDIAYIGHTYKRRVASRSCTLKVRMPIGAKK